MKNIVVCFYHNEDWDGIASAIIVNNHYKAKDDDLVYFVGVDYSVKSDDHFVQTKLHDICEDHYNKFIDEKDLTYNIKDDNIEVTIVIVDYSFSADIMKHLDNEFNLIWIDHHVSAIKDAIANEYADVNGHRYDGVAACMLAWQYYNLGEKPPLPLALFGKYDVFDKTDLDDSDFVYKPNVTKACYTWDDVIKHQTYMKSIKDNAEVYVHSQGLKKEDIVYNLDRYVYDVSIVDSAIQDGKLLNNYISNKAILNHINNGILVQLYIDKIYICNNAFVIMGQGGGYDDAVIACLYKYNIKPFLIVAVNHSLTGIRYGFNAIHPALDASAIARMFPNGGGHRAVAGCQSSTQYHYDSATKILTLYTN